MLPSEKTARTLLAHGWRAAWPMVVRDVLERTALIAVGQRLAGVDSYKSALVASLVVEAAVIAWVRGSVFPAPPIAQGDQ